MAGTLGFGADAMAAVQINTAEGGAGAAPPRTSPCAHTCRSNALLRRANTQRVCACRLAQAASAQPHSPSASGGAVGGGGGGWGVDEIVVAQDPVAGGR